jgi:hypothetical protein
MLFEKFFKIIKKSLQNQSHHPQDSYVIYIKCSFSALRSSLFHPLSSLFSLLSSLPPRVRLWLHIDLYLAVGVDAHDDPRSLRSPPHVRLWLHLVDYLD